MNSSVDKLTLVQGISIGIGSIIGSGVLFLPSMTLSLAGTDAILGWLLIIVFCFPGLYFLREMVGSTKENDGIAGFISLGLGKDVGNSIPILLLGTVTIGMPSAAIVAGQYVQAMWPMYSSVAVIVPYVMIIATILTTLKGVKTSAKLNTLVTLLLILVGTTLFFKTAPQLKAIHVPDFDYNFTNILNSAVLAFWAFAGFENLTFLSNNFHNPRRDLLISAGVAIIVCGLLYLGLTYNISVLIKREEINSSLGLMQLADFIEPIYYSKLLITLFAFFAVMINLVSWTAGISNAIVSASKRGMLPGSLSILKSNVPNRAVLALGLAFLISTTIGVTSVSVFKSMLTLVSSNFLVLYLLSLLSYFRFTQNKTKKFISLALSFGILIVLLSYKWLLIYPVVLISLSMLFSRSLPNKEAMNEA